MNPIVLYGSENDDEITCVLLAALRSLRIGVLHIGAKSITLLPPNTPAPSILLLDDGCVHTVQMDDCILIFKHRCIGQAAMQPPRACAAVLESDNDDAVAMLQARRIPTVTCGLSQKDTVTFSSHEPGTAVVSLLRSIHGTADRTVEPRELPVAFSTPRGDYPLLAGIAALWLAGVQFPEKGLSI